MSTKYPDSYWASSRTFSLGSRRPIDEVFKKGHLARAKILAFFISYYRAWQTSGSILSGCTRSSGNHSASKSIISVTPKRLLETQFFERKRQSFHWEKHLGVIFLVLSNMTNVREQLLRAHKLFDEYCSSSSYKIFSSGHKQSRTKVFKLNAIIPKENLWPIFFHITHRGRHLVSIV